MLSRYKAFAALILSLSLTACASTPTKVADHVGDIKAQQLLTSFIKFEQSYQSFNVSNTQASQVQSLPDDLVIDIYFATWCHDSQREVPRLLKALQTKPDIKINLVSLDYQKQEPTGRAAQAGVKFTPTFIVSREGKELGRIIERPKIDLVSDISAMIN